MNETIQSELTQEKEQDKVETIKATLDRFHELEIEKVFDALLQISNWRIQIGVFFGTVNLGGIAVAMSTQNAGIIFLSSLLILGFMLIDAQGYRARITMYVRAIQLENQFAPDDGSTFLTMILGHYEYYQRIAVLKSRNERDEAIMRALLRNSSTLGFRLPLFAFIAEIVFGVFLWQQAGWTLF